MKITKARLKEIINEELEAAMTPEESDAAYRAAAPVRRAASEDFAGAISQYQKERGHDAPRYAALKDRLLQLYKQERDLPPDAEEALGLGNVIHALETEIEEIKRTHDLDA